MKALLALALAIVLAASADAALPVFPGAVGFGSRTVAGRAATDDKDHIYRVTRLDDPDFDNPPEGTLRYGIETVTGPRVIVFEVSGVIELRRDLIIRPTVTKRINNEDVVIDQGYLTIAGQTAPYPGITLKNGGIRIYSHEVLIQHIAIRPGVYTTTDPTWDLAPIDNRDCVGLEDGARKIVVDHITCSWTTDETATGWAEKNNVVGSISEVTFSNNIFAYPIWYSGHTGDTPEHGLGMLIGAGTSNVSIVRNVMAFAENRNPLIRHQTGGAQVVNNFVFRPGANRNSVLYIGYKFALQPDTFETKVSAIGNLAYLIRARKAADDLWHGKTNDAHQEGILVHADANPKLFLYLDGNYTYQPDVAGADAFQPKDETPALQYSQPYYSYKVGDPAAGKMVLDDGHRLTADPYASLNAYGATWTPIRGSPAYLKSKIVPGAGKFSGQRDYYDTDLMKKINDPDDDSAWLYSQADLGAQPWAPVDIQNTRPFITTNPTLDDDHDGYTNLEEQLHHMAEVVEGRRFAAPIDPAIAKFDDFTDGVAEGWTTAVAGATDSWAVSGGTFVQAADQDSRALLNGTNWTDQVVQATVTASQFTGTTSFVAVYARFQDIQNAYYIRLRSNGALELKRIKGNVITLYSSKPAGTYNVSLPHVLRLEVVGNSLKAFIDDLSTPALTGTDNEWGIDSGKAGIGASLASAAFDNVFASPFSPGPRVTDDFDDQNFNGWSMPETGTGSWTTPPSSPNAANRMLRQSQTTLNQRAQRAALGRDQSTQARVRFGANSDQNGFIAVYARYQDMSNTYYALLRHSLKLELKKIINGTTPVTFAWVDLDPATFDLTKWHTLRIEASGGKLTTLKAYLDGQLQLVGSDVDNPFTETKNAAFGTFATAADFDDVVLSKP